MVSMGNTVYCKARCEPEMKTKKPYALKLSVEVVGCGGIFRKTVKCVTFAECSCPSGKALFTSYKHLAAFFYAVEDFGELGFTRDLVTCTEELQTWNKPHNEKSEPMLLTGMVLKGKGDWTGNAQG